MARDRTNPSAHRCEVCGVQVSAVRWTSYFCPDCRGHQDRLYRREHIDPGYARSLSKDDIRGEYERAGIAWEAA